MSMVKMKHEMCRMKKGLMSFSDSVASDQTKSGKELCCLLASDQPKSWKELCCLLALDQPKSGKELS